MSSDNNRIFKLSPREERVHGPAIGKAGIPRKMFDTNQKLSLD